MKNILLLLFLFLIFTAGFLYILFPYQIVVDNVVKGAIKKQNLDIKYKSIYSNPFMTKVEDVKSYGVSISKIIVKHSLLNILKRKIDFFTNIEGIEIIGQVGIKSAEFSGLGDISTFSKYLQNIAIKGNLSIEGKYEFDNEALLVSIRSQDTSAYYSSLSLNFGEVTAKIEGIKNKLSLKNLESKGKDRLSVEGTIMVNYLSPYNSRLDFKGKLSSEILSTTFKLNGSLNYPQLRFQ